VSTALSYSLLIGISLATLILIYRAITAKSRVERDMAEAKEQAAIAHAKWLADTRKEIENARIPPRGVDNPSLYEL
jgi:cell division septum initiation protein DivIVA